MSNEEISSKATVEFCGDLYNPQDPKSPRCAVAKNAHAGKPHQAMNPQGGVLEWPYDPSKLRQRAR